METYKELTPGSTGAGLVELAYHGEKVTQIAVQISPSLL